MDAQKDNAPDAAATVNSDPLEQVITDLVDANHILLHHRIVDSFGHISVRHPHRDDRFLMSRRIAPGLVTRDCVREFGLDGEMIGNEVTPSFLERYIHSAIYLARPDVNSVIHSHSPAVIPFGVVPSQPLRAVCHTGKFIGERLPIFEIRDVAGPSSNMLITNQKLGVALAESLGDQAVVLMRGHGSTAVGASIQEAVFRAIYVEVNAQIQSTALTLGGDITYLSPGECMTGAENSADALKRTWDYWKNLVENG